MTKLVTIEYLHAYLKGSGAKFAKDGLRDVKRQINNYNRRFRHEIMTDLGLKRVKGALGGVYYE